MIYKNPSATLAGHDKVTKYCKDARVGAVARGADGQCVPLEKLPVDAVEFIAGLWRVQVDFPHEIITVRGRAMVLGRKHDAAEFGAFHYYDGYLVSNNCYGPFIGDTPNYVVGRVDTATGPIWAYGASIPAVRAFLSVALFDRNRSMIFSAEGMNIDKNSR